MAEETKEVTLPKRESRNPLNNAKNTKQGVFADGKHNMQYFFLDMIQAVDYTGGVERG